MACTSPLSGFRAPGGKITLDRKRALTPFALKLACGQCIACRIARQQMWTARILHEAQITEERGLGSSFITLTYDDAHLPQDLSIRKRDWQMFAKRMRHELGSFRYFHCGEYGTLTNRPHYHAIIFGIDFINDRQAMKPGKFGTLYYSETLTRLWGMGQTSVGSVTAQSAAYCAKYATKRLTGEMAKRAYTRTDGETTWEVTPEYATMSLKPGLGEAWLQKYKNDIYPRDETIIAGRRFRTPRFYDAALTEHEREQVKELRRQKARDRAEDLTTERLKVREEILEAKTKTQRQRDTL